MFPGMDPAQLQQMMSSPQFAGVRQMMQTPEMQRLVQQLTSEPSISDSLKQMQEAAMSGNLQNVMQSIQGNPKVMQFVQQMGTQMFAQNPMLQALQNPGNREKVEAEMAELQKDPEMAELMKEMQSQGPNALQKYWNDPEILKKFSKYGERLAQTGMLPGMAEGAGQGSAEGNAVTNQLNGGSDGVEQATRELKAATLNDGAEAQQDEEEFVCLQDAVLEGDLDLLKDVLEAGIPVDDADEENRTAFHFACGYGEVEIAKELISRGADINIQDKSGNSPLHYAAGYGKVTTAQLLVEQAGLDKDAKNAEGMTAYEVAKLNEYKDIMELLPEPAAKA